RPRALSRLRLARPHALPDKVAALVRGPMFSGCESSARRCPTQEAKRPAAGLALRHRSLLVTPVTAHGGDASAQSPGLTGVVLNEEDMMAEPIVRPVEPSATSRDRRGLLVCELLTVAALIASLVSMAPRPA